MSPLLSVRTRQENQVPIIILEGIDGSGKSTLATHLKDLSPWPATIAVGQIPQSTEAVFETLIAPMFEVGPDELLIADRWHLSELIYGPLYRNQSLIDMEALDQIETVLKSLDAMRIVMSPAVDEVTSRLEARGEDFLKPEHQILVHAAYHGLGTELGYAMLAKTDRMAAMTILGLLAHHRMHQ